MDQFTPQRIEAPELVTLSRRVHVVADPEIDAGGADSRHATKLTIRLRDGRTIGGARQHARGSAAVPLQADEVRRKFQLLAAKAVDRRTVEMIETLVARLDESENVRDLLNLLAA